MSVRKWNEVPEELLLQFKERLRSKHKKNEVKK